MSSVHTATNASQPTASCHSWRSSPSRNHPTRCLQPQMNEELQSQSLLHRHQTQKLSPSKVYYFSAKRETRGTGLNDNSLRDEAAVDRRKRCEGNVAQARSHSTAGRKRPQRNESKAFRNVIEHQQRRTLGRNLPRQAQAMPSTWRVFHYY